MPKRLVVFGDGVTKTGFSCVLHNILGNLPKNKFDVHQVAINYYGDPHPYGWKMYPASLRGDLWGFNRIKEFAESGVKIDGIFILNDPWVVHKYLEKFKQVFKEFPPIVVYTPIDSKELDPLWFENYDIVDKLVVYTQFGYDEVKKSRKEIEPIIIGHGVDGKTFYKLDLPKREIKKKIFPDKEDFLDLFIFLNANRNQPRKRIDLTIEGFAKFAENKPKNVKLYLHMGTRDAGWDILKLAYRYKIDDRLIITNTSPTVQQVPDEKLNIIYNACEVGVNSSLGEGWGLVNHEHARTGAPQIVPDNSCMQQLYGDCGLIVPVNQWLTNIETLTVSGIVDSDGIADAMERIYQDKDLYKELSQKTFDKFTSEEYSWKGLVRNKWIPLFEETFIDSNRKKNEVFTVLEKKADELEIKEEVKEI